MDTNGEGITRRAGLQGSVAAGLAVTLPAAKSAGAATGVAALVDISKTGEPISRFIYGAFSEHIQGFIYRALWAEVLSDRKFYYAVDDQDPSIRKWRPLDVSLAGFAPRSRGRLWRLTGPSLDSSNQVGQPPQVTVTESQFDTGDGRLSVQPYSVELRAYTSR